MNTICKALGHRQPYRPLSVVTPDRLTIPAQDWGETAPGKRDILFIHGFSQSHLCWLKQVTSTLAEEFRIVTYDNRGHGNAEKPCDPSCYREKERWAGEVDAVIRQARLQSPVIVAWSYAGRIALDYVAVHGDIGIGALVMVNATSQADPSMLGPAAAALRQMGANDLSDAVTATNVLLDNCTARPLPRDERDLMCAYNMMTPPFVRAAMAGRPADYDAVLRGLSVPVLAVHGAEDRINLPAMASYTAGAAPGGRSIVYPDVGHMPFWEVPERFNADLAEFVRALA